MKIEVSHGEILDKFSILQIKKKKIKDKQKLQNVQKEYDTLDSKVTEILETSRSLYEELLTVNEKLWEIEDDIRACEQQKDFGERFIELARSVYLINDKRAVIKKKINLLTKSELVEEKSYHSIS